MFGECVFVGYAKQKVDAKNRIILPAFTKAEAGDSVVLIPEEDQIAIYSSERLNNYFEKINKLNITEQAEFFKTFRSYCESIILEAKVDNQRRISLSQNIEVLDNQLEFIGSGDRVLMRGNVKFPDVYKKRV